MTPETEMHLHKNEFEIDFKNVRTLGPSGTSHCIILLLPHRSKQIKWVMHKSQGEIWTHCLANLSRIIHIYDECRVDVPIQYANVCARHLMHRTVTKTSYSLFNSLNFIRILIMTTNSTVAKRTRIASVAWLLNFAFTYFCHIFVWRAEATAMVWHVNRPIENNERWIFRMRTEKSFFHNRIVIDRVGDSTCAGYRSAENGQSDRFRLDSHGSVFSAPFW